MQCFSWTLAGPKGQNAANWSTSQWSILIDSKSSNWPIACCRSVGWNPSVSAVLVTRKASSWASAIAARVLSMASQHDFYLVWFNPFEQVKGKKLHEIQFTNDCFEMHKPGSKASSTLHDSKNSFAALPSTLFCQRLRYPATQRTMAEYVGYVNLYHIKSKCWWWKTLDYDDDACKPLCQTFPGTLTPCKQAVASYAAPIAPQVFEGIRSGAWLLEGSCLSLGGQGKTVKKSQQFALISLGFCWNLPSNISNHFHLAPNWQISLRNKGGIGAFVKVMMLPLHTCLALHWGKGQLWLPCLLSCQIITSRGQCQGCGRKSLW